MNAQFSFGSITLAAAPGKATARVSREPDAPFVLGILGDFSGRASRGICESLANRRSWPIDCDNFEQAPSRLEVCLRLPDPQIAANRIELKFDSLDDFHPDHFLKRIEPLARLQDARKRLLNPSTANTAAEQLQGLLSGAAPAAPGPPPPATSESNADTLARLLGKTDPSVSPTPPSTASSPLQSLIQGALGASAVPAASPQQAALLSAAELELGSQLRAVLHHPAFQALEATWRGADMLVRGFGGEDNLKLRLIDITKEELAKDLQAGNDLAATGLHRLLQRTPDSAPFTVLLGLYSFCDSVEDVELLGRLAKVASAAQAPFLATATPDCVGCDGFNLHPDPDDWTMHRPAVVREAWQALRALSESTYLALALPRFLLRQPYGKQSDPIDAFPFEELTAALAHESYLWGNPAILCGTLLAPTFLEEGWSMSPSVGGEVGNLPIHKFTREGEIEVKPCAEAWLSERASDAVSKQGFVPVLSVKGSDSVRVTTLQSLRSPATPLAGRW